jgi:hypothetical protein
MRRALITFALAVAGAATAAEGEFASVNGTSISAAEFEAARANAVRQKFYHREVPEVKLDEFSREVAQTLIDRVLLQAEIRRRGLVPDEAHVRAEIAQYESRYAQSERWQKNRAALLPGWSGCSASATCSLGFRPRCAKAGTPSDQDLARYYDSHRSLFTEPEQARLSVIVLKVDPSAPAATWTAAEEEARAIRKRVAAGADFAKRRACIRAMRARPTAATLATCTRA